MDKIIAFMSQKGGVGKSTLARAVACEACRNGLSVKLADLDTQQGTSTEWHRQRLNNGYEPIGSVEVFSTAKTAIKESENFDLLVIDGVPRASKGTLETAKHSDLIILPCCASRDDLTPTFHLAFELEKKGIPKEKIFLALVRVSTEAEILEARQIIKQAGLLVLDGCLYEKPAYRQAQNKGLAVMETPYKSLNKKTDQLLKSIVNNL
jgi:chromosome partitioning protein